MKLGLCATRSVIAPAVSTRAALHRGELESSLSMINFVAMGVGCSLLPGYVRSIRQEGVVFSAVALAADRQDARADQEEGTQRPGGRFPSVCAPDAVLIAAAAGRRSAVRPSHPRQPLLHALDDHISRTDLKVGVGEHPNVAVEDASGSRGSIRSHRAGHMPRRTR
jgi:hypothetical protein